MSRPRSTVDIRMPRLSQLLACSAMTIPVTTRKQAAIPVERCHRCALPMSMRLWNREQAGDDESRTGSLLHLVRSPIACS